MNTVLTAIQVFLMFGFSIGGLSQILVPQARYAQLPAQGWAHDFKPWHIKLIGFLKMGAAVGMMASLALPSLKLLMPLGAVGIALVMAGAMATHLRREEYPNVVGNIAFMGSALFVAYSTLFGVAA